MFKSPRDHSGLPCKVCPHGQVLKPRPAGIFFVLFSGEGMSLVAVFLGGQETWRFF